MPVASVSTDRLLSTEVLTDQSWILPIKEDTELHLPIWHCGMCEVFLMHVSTAINAIEKQGTFKAHDVDQHKAAMQAKAALAVLNAVTSKGEKTSKKASQKTNEGVVLTDAPDPELQAEYKKDFQKANKATETAKNKKESAAKNTFQFYVNLLSADTKYAWNKIIREQTKTDPFKDFQGMSRKSPRGLLCKSFNDCVMFHLLTVFPNNAVEQESQTCLRNPSVSACIILCSMWSNSLLHCATTMLALQPQCQAQCISCKCTIH